LRLVRMLALLLSHKPVNWTPRRSSPPLPIFNM
jgi:hypothetical protein